MAIASISWEINLLGTSLSVRSIEMYIGNPVTSDGHVDWYLGAGGRMIRPIPGSTWKSADVYGAKKITLTASMTGGTKPRLMTADMNVAEGTTLNMEVKLQGKIAQLKCIKKIRYTCTVLNHYFRRKFDG